MAEQASGGTQTATDAAKRRAFGVVFLTLFLDLLGFGIIIPIQPFYAERFGASPAVVTLLGASYSAMQFLFTPFWGRLSDRIGRRPVVLSSIAFGASGFLLFGFASSLPMLFAARMLAGFGNANMATVQAIVADVTTGKERAKGMGMVGAAFGLGFVCGPIIGGLGTHWFGPQVPAFIAAGLGAVNLLLAIVRLPETRNLAQGAHGRRSLFDVAAFGAAFKQASIARILLVSFAVTMGFALMETALSLFIEHTWVPTAIDASATAAQREAGHREASLRTGEVLLVVGLVSALVQGGLIGRLQRRFGEPRLARTGIVVLGVAMAIMPFVAQPGLFWTMFVLGAAFAVGSGLVQPSISSLLSRSARDDEQGAVLGVGQSLSSLGRVFGPSMSGLLFQRSHGLPFAVGAALMCCAFAVALGVTRPRDDVESAR